MTWNNLPLHHLFTAQSEIIIGASAKNAMAWAFTVHHRHTYIVDNETSAALICTLTYAIQPINPYALTHNNTISNRERSHRHRKIETNKCISNRNENYQHTQFPGQMYLLCVKVISIMLSTQLVRFFLLFIHWLYSIGVFHSWAFHRDSICLTMC